MFCSIFYLSPGSSKLQLHKSMALKLSLPQKNVYHATNLWATVPIPYLSILAKSVNLVF